MERRKFKFSEVRMLSSELRKAIDALVKLQAPAKTIRDGDFISRKLRELLMKEAA